MDIPGQLLTAVVSDQVLQISRSNPYEAADLDRSKIALLDEAPHRLLGHPQDLGHLADGVQRFELLHGRAPHSAAARLDRRWSKTIHCARDEHASVCSGTGGLLRRSPRLSRRLGGSARIGEVGRPPHDDRAMQLAARCVDRPRSEPAIRGLPPVTG